MKRVALTGVPLSKIDFGAPAAERDIERGLGEYFVESDAYDRVRSGSKRIVLGSRGIGKSAIFQMLAQRERESGSYVIDLSPEDYSYELLSQTMAAESSGSWVKIGAYAAAWKYLIYVLIMKEIAKKRVALKKGAGHDIYRYIRDHHSRPQASKPSALVSYLKRLESLKIGRYEASVRARELEKLYKLEEIHALLPSLREVASSRRIVVLVDELDRGWDSSEDARAFVAGLFQACIAVNAVHPNLRIYMSLRQELYDDIPELHEDAQKYRDLIETIQWTEVSLLNLITKRIRHSVVPLAGRDDGTCWDSLFGRMPGQQNNGSFAYVINRTLYRPREIIQFCIQATERGRDLCLQLPVDFAAIQDAEVLYSNERARDIAAEFRFQYPGLLDIFDAFRGRSGRPLGRDEVEFVCLELIIREIPSSGTKPWLDDCIPETLIDILWQTGFLLAEGAPAGDRGASGGSFVGIHQVPHLNVAAVHRFQIHPMFWSYLGFGR
jgi:hypothetical protein